MRTVVASSASVSLRAIVSGSPRCSIAPPGPLGRDSPDCSGVNTVRSSSTHERPTSSRPSPAMATTAVGSTDSSDVGSVIVAVGSASTSASNRYTASSTDSMP